MNTSAVGKKKTGNRSICYYDYDETSAVFKRHALPKKKKREKNTGFTISKVVTVTGEVRRTTEALLSRVLRKREAFNEPLNAGRGAAEKKKV